MKNKENYYTLRDNLAIGIAKMADKFDEYKIYDDDFEDLFQYTLIQLKKFDDLWDRILKNFCK